MCRHVVAIVRLDRPFLSWGLGSAVSSPAGSGAEPQPKSNLVHYNLKIWDLVVTIFIILLRISWSNLVRWQLGFLLTLVIHCRSDYWYSMDGRTGRTGDDGLDSVVVAGGGWCRGNCHHKFCAVGKLSEKFLLLENLRPKCKKWGRNPQFSKNRGKIEILSSCLSKNCNFLSRPAYFFLTHDAAGKSESGTDVGRFQVLWLSICEGSSKRWAMRASRRWFCKPITRTWVASA